MARPLPNYRPRAELPSLLSTEASPDKAYLDLVDADGEPATADSGTYALVNSVGSTVASGACTVDGSVLESPALPTATMDLGDGYRERWSFVFGSETLQIERDAIVCRYVLACPIGKADLTRAMSSLDGSATSRVATPNLDDAIDEAWLTIQLRLIEAGRRPWLSTSAYALRECTLALALAMVLENISTQPAAVTMDLAQQKRKEFEQAWGRVRLTLTYVTGEVGDARKAATPGVTWLRGRG